jgi:hypothetical protein
MALSQKGVTIGRKGNVHYKGDTFKASQWSTSPLVEYVTGEKATALNQKKIEADPNYQMALSNLALTRDQSQAGLDAQRRQSLLDYGDPSFVQGDPVLAAAVAANPFSTSRLQQQNYLADQRGAAQTSNRAGTLFGGGYQSGQLEATHQFAGNSFQSTSALQNLLNALSLQGQQLGQNYNLGAQNALLQTQQNLAQAGTLSASAPKLALGRFRLFKPPRITQPHRNRLTAGGGPGLPHRPQGGRPPIGGGIG